MDRRSFFRGLFFFKIVVCFDLFGERFVGVLDFSRGNSSSNSIGSSFWFFFDG